MLARKISEISKASSGEYAEAFAELTQEVSLLEETLPPDHEFTEDIRKSICDIVRRRMLEDILAWGEVGRKVWTTFSRECAADYDTFYLRTSAPVLRERVRMMLLDMKEEVLEAEKLEWNLFQGMTLHGRYLLRDPVTHEVVETPARMYARAAAGVLCAIADQEKYERHVLRLFRSFAKRYFTTATPGIANAGRFRQMLSSCFLLTLGIYANGDPDSMNGIGHLLRVCMNISAAGGGVGFTIDVRAMGQPINGSGGFSKGLVSALVPYESEMKYCDQGGSRDKKKVGGGRLGAWAVYVEMHHPDLPQLLESKREVRIYSKGSLNTEEALLHDLFLALWISDLFMERVRRDEEWSFFSVDTAPGLCDVWGDEYKALYHKYESEGRAVKTMRAVVLFRLVVDTMIETSGPYIMYKDACNELSQQKNIGTIRSSNLCCVAGNQRVPTNRGIFTAKELCDMGGPNVVPGRDKLEIATPMGLPRPNAEIIRIHTQEGYTHDVTPDHPVWKRGHGWLQARLLKEGDLIEMQQIEGPWGPENHPDLAMIVGVFNTTPYMQQAVFPILVDFLALEDSPFTHCFNRYLGKKLAPQQIATYDRSELAAMLHQDLKELKVSKLCGEVPAFVWRSDRMTAIRYLQGIYSTAEAMPYLHIPGPVFHFWKKTFLQELQILWANFGVKTRIIVSHPEDYPELKETIYSLATDSKTAYAMMLPVLHPSMQKEPEENPHAFRSQFVVVERLEDRKNEDAYCLTVDSDDHAWVCNGLVTKNTEIVEYTSHEEIAVCNLGSMSLPEFVDTSIEGGYNWKLFSEQVGILANALFYSIYSTVYPDPLAEVSNKKRRPIAIGIQGLAQVFGKLMWTWESEEARNFNRRMIMYMYYAALSESCRLCEEEHVKPYEGFQDSPLAQGKFAFDLFAERTKSRKRIRLGLCPDLDWERLRERIMDKGVAMSLHIALMPTSGTAAIFMNFEGFAPPLTNLFIRSTSAGRFVMPNIELAKQLKKRGLWTKEIINEIIARDGIISEMEQIPQEIRDVFKTVYEIPLMLQAEYMLDRVPFVDQAQSYNTWIDPARYSEPVHKILMTLLFYLWEQGSKNGSYYFRMPKKTKRERILDSSSISRSSESSSNPDEMADSCPIGCESCGT